MARHVTRGVTVDKETLTVDAIAEGVATGDFLSLKHTARNFREQFWFPRLMDRYRHGEWEAAGRKTMGDRVRERIRQIIAEHRADPLSADVTTQLDQVVAGQTPIPANSEQARSI